MNNMAKYYVHEIPEGYEARIEGNKVIIELAESEDEKTRKEIIKFIQDFSNPCDPDCDKWIAYLEKQKEQKPAEWSEWEYGRLFDIEHYLEGTLQLSPDRKIACIDFLKSFHPVKQEWSEEDKEALDMCLDAIPKAWKTKSGILLTKWLKDNIHLQPKQEWSEEKAKSIIDDYEKTAWI